jgi:hypothetical protein
MRRLLPNGVNHGVCLVTSLICHLLPTGLLPRQQHRLVTAFTLAGESFEFKTVTDNREGHVGQGASTGVVTNTVSSRRTPTVRDTVKELTKAPARSLGSCGGDGLGASDDIAVVSGRARRSECFISPYK